MRRLLFLALSKILVDRFSAASLAGVRRACASCFLAGVLVETVSYGRVCVYEAKNSSVESRTNHDVIEVGCAQLLRRVGESR